MDLGEGADRSAVPEISGPDAVDPLIGCVLEGTYTIVRKIGEGGMGTVYKATHSRLSQKRLAIKFLNPGILQNKEIYLRFRREAEIATAIGHPNIVDVLDFNVTKDKQPYIVMEFLDGENLAERIERVGALPLGDVIQVIGESASALQAAHDKDIIHRDLKPENFFLMSLPNGRFIVKILDFGISKILHSTTVMTQDQFVMGTPHYMAPEQAEGSPKDIDHRSDVFSLGTICYQILSNSLPFDAPTLPGVFYKVCRTEPQPLSEVMEGLPDGVSEVITRALAKEKDDRYQRIEDFAADLTAAISGADPLCHDIDSPFRRKIAVPLGDRVPSGYPVALPPASNTVDALGATTGPGVTERSHTTLHGRPSRRLPILLGLVGVVAVCGVVSLVVLTRGSTEGVAGGSSGAGKGKKILVAKTTAPPAVAGAGKVTGAKSPAVTPPVSAPLSAPLSATSPATKRPGKPKSRVRIRLKLRPRHARVKIDGVRRRDNPLRLVRSRDAFRLRVEANGYHPLVRGVVPSANRTIRVTLKKKSTRSSTSGAQRKPPKKPPKKKERLRFDDL